MADYEHTQILPEGGIVPAGMETLGSDPAVMPYDVGEQFDKDPVVQSVLASQGTSDPTSRTISSIVMTSIVQTIVSVVRSALGAVSPQIRQEIEQFVQKLDEQAKATDNPYDDIAVGFLKVITGTSQSA